MASLIKHKINIHCNGNEPTKFLCPSKVILFIERKISRVLEYILKFDKILVLRVLTFLLFVWIGLF